MKLDTHRRLPARSLADVTLDEDVYRADFELGDKYQAFSGEIARLALLGIAGYGFLFAQLPPDNDAASAEFFRKLRPMMPLLATGLAALGLACGTALAHRFFATDCLTHQVTIVRLLRRRENEHWSAAEREDDERRLDQERSDQRYDLRRCRLLLQTSAALMFVGAVLAAVSFVRAVLAL